MSLRKLLCAALFLLFAGAATAQNRVSETRYDWSALAHQIAGDADGKYQQAYRIYRGLCENIAYDTTYTIYHSDDCFDRKRGVCQAYCELFYRLGEPLGLEVDIISGKSKDQHGKIGDVGHAWVFVHMSGTSGFLVDATWGAGSVDGSTFTRSVNDDSWFDVDPRWMIFSHFPDPELETYQLLPEKIDFEQFCRLPSYRPAYESFGQDPGELLNRCLAGETPDIPDYYASELSRAEVNNIPLEGTLRIGRYYDFAIKRKTGDEFMIRNGERCFYSNDWEKIQGYDVCRFMPSEEGSLTVSIRDGGNRWSVLAGYKVAPASASDIASLEAAEPEHSPVFARLGNYSEREMREHNVDFATLLKAVKSRNITSLPLFYSGAGYGINEIPWSGTLRRGESYTFRIAPYEQCRWAVINEGDWYYEWEKDPSAPGIMITVTPQNAGRLVISAEGATKNSFRSCFEYKVE